VRAKYWLTGALVAGAGIVVVGLALMHRLDRDRLYIETERWLRRVYYVASDAPLPGTPDLGNLDGRLAAAGLELGAPVFIRIFKLEFELEIWMKHGDRFQRFAVYPICRWSGLLGPKLAEGDWQAPEGFYTVDAKALNPASRWHRAINLGYPNLFDRAHGRTGSYLMVHGGCSSIGCYAMTNAVIDEIWRLVSAALERGQPRFHVHVFPFRMTEQRLAEHEGAPWAAFWQELKPGYDAFEATQLPPKVTVCQGHYHVSPDRPGTAGSSPIEAACPNATGAKT
jgi:murein L,D-transpeptidase YafK